MPIYEYHCLACGHQKDVLQKVTDDPLVVCPACGEEQFSKKVSAPGFQLKGTGWYETDFKNKSGGDQPGRPSDSSAGQATGAESTAKKESTSKGSDSSGGSAATAA